MKIIPTLCCLFKQEPIKFKTFTIKSLEKLSEIEKAQKVHSVYLHNIQTLQLALDKCNDLGIKSYRISSDLLPKFNYIFENNILPSGFEDTFKTLLQDIKTHNIILSMHPDQFCIMNSLSEDVIRNSVEILKYHLWLSDCLNISSINIHIGGTYGDKENAKIRFVENMKSNFSTKELMKITIENDEKSFDINDILEICYYIPELRPVFDIHHYKCYNMKKESNLKDSNIRYYLRECRKIWKDNYFDYFQIHLSSPRDDRYETLKGSSPHSDLIDTRDIIDLKFLDFDIVVDIEAKDKELAVLDFVEKLGGFRYGIFK